MEKNKIKTIKKVVLYLLIFLFVTYVANNFEYIMEQLNEGAVDGWKSSP